MRQLIVVAFVAAALSACRGEPVPRDYQNAPPAMTHPAATKSDTPASGGQSGQAPPLPSTGAEGTAAPYEPVTPPAKSDTTMSDTSPVTTTT